jgi:glutamyl-tRNA synthetase
VEVDDHFKGMTHVLRAEEHLTNTPKQLVIYDAFGWKAPEFGHMPMILAPDRSKLSKRHGATSVEEFREKGYLHQAIINYLTLLGWAPGNDEEIFTLEDTVKQFDFSKMSHKAAVYDVKKLTWLNGQYLSSLPLREIADAAVPFFKKAGLIDDDYLPAHQEYFDHLVDVVRVRVKTLVELADGSSYFFKDFDEYDPKGVKKSFKPEAADLLQKAHDALAALPEFNLETTEACYNKLAEDLGTTLGKVIHPTRLALTGRTFSPGMFDVMVLLGREKTLERLDKAIAFIKAQN